ncbi:unnamed protein product [Adineta steineri]|uniref:Tyrosine specific protein phosphatases domain-containing protein n=2 Tax=Adineta steineri TaxID=433720 RepID=A0A819BHW3_9BILA|nr:unnamed protein product [Adineta steineri]
MQLCTIDTSCCGPTSTSHWIIRDVLLASAYPGAKDYDEHRQITRSIYESGVHVFVNLMEPKELVRFTPYESDIQEYARQDNQKIKFISFPMPDQYICRDNEKLLDFCLNLCKRIRDDQQKILVHCWGGHGRTGTIMSILIGIIFNLEADDAIKYNYQLKRQRLRVKGKTSSLHSRQCEQVQTVLRIYQDQQESFVEQEI